MKRLGLPKLLRTSSFRLTVAYAAVFSLSSLLLFGIVAWSASGFMQIQIDRTVANELDEIRADAALPDSPGLRAIVSELARNSPGLAYQLQSQAGRVLAGNIPTAMRQVVGTRVLRRRLGRIRGRGVRLTEGFYLFVGMSDLEERELREAIVRAFAAGFAAVLALSIGGGLLTGLGVLRRVEAISRTSRDIMAGDLGRRIALADTGDEFDHLAISLNAMLERIETLLAGLRRMSGDIAHDLRTPLNRLRQRLELARENARGEDALRAAVDGAIADADGILATFGALLRIVQIEARARRAGFATVALSDLLEELADAYEPVAEERRQTITRAIEPGLTLSGDKELLTQLFANLIENAIRHTPEATPVSIEARRTPAGIEAAIADRGPGVPRDLRARVLAPFFRLETSRSTPGNGLGLGLVAAIAALHEAALALEEHQPGLRCRLVFSEPGSDQRGDIAQARTALPA